MKIFIALALSLLTTQAFANLNIPTGLYNCPITIEERVDIVLADGADFPTFRGRFDPPIIRPEIIQIAFTNEDQPRAKILNPEILPNWLFVSPAHYDRFTSFSWIIDEPGEKAIVYQIDYRGTWYFGSKVSVQTAEVKRNSAHIKIHITFDDNDGWWYTQKWVKCFN